MKTIGIYNNKGGVGKTTLAVHLAFYASDQGISTTAVGLDSQGDMFRWLADPDAPEDGDGMYKRGEKLTVLYSPKEQPAIKDELVIIDCPPAVETVLDVSVSIWVVPLLDRMSFENMHTVLRDLHESSDQIWLVINRAGQAGDAAARELAKAVKLVRNAYCYPNPIPNSKTIARAIEHRVPAWDVPWGGKARGTQVLRGFCKDVLVRCGFSPDLKGTGTDD
ncbi:MAG: ParA family protein [Myxococcales bacterium]|nr:ParA family protein [Myxococcales bacterium]